MCLGTYLGCNFYLTAVFFNWCNASPNQIATSNCLLSRGSVSLILNPFLRFFFTSAFLKVIHTPKQAVPSQDVPQDKITLKFGYFCCFLKEKVRLFYLNALVEHVWSAFHIMNLNDDKKFRFFFFWFLLIFFDIFENFDLFLTIFYPIRYWFCPGTEEFVPGHLLLSLSWDKGTPGQGKCPCPGTKRQQDVPSLGNANV